MKEMRRDPFRSRNTPKFGASVAVGAAVASMGGTSTAIAPPATESIKLSCNRRETPVRNALPLSANSFQLSVCGSGART
jgi:hypothetical protein